MFMATTSEITDSKQEAILAQARARAVTSIGVCFAFSFVSVKVEQAFSSVLHSNGIRPGRLRLEIAEVSSDGYIQAQIKLTDDDKKSCMVVGNSCRNDKLKEVPVRADNNKPVQQQPPPTAINETEANNTDSMTLRADNTHGLASTNAPGETMINRPLVMPSDHNIPVTPLSNKSHMQFYSTRSQLSSSSVSTDAFVEQASSSTAQDGTTKEASTMPCESTRRKQHTINFILHEAGKSPCRFCKTPEECKSLYDEAFGNEIKQFLNKEQDPSLTNKANSVYLECIKNHLKNKNCPSSFCSRLWRFCAMNKICNTFQYADEGLLIFSKFRKEKIGSICTDYMNLKAKSAFTKLVPLGQGGFGKVYQYEQPETGRQLAIKVEEKHPLTECGAKLFQKIISLNHPNVIEMIEYLTGPVNEKGKRLCLFVMPLLNQRDLDKQFEIGTCKCILDYMQQYPEIQQFIFRNYLSMFCQVFEGLQYLKTQHIVHRDIKPSNILVHQKCNCPSAVQCTCHDNPTMYVVGDLDLLCFEGTSSTMKFEDWIMTQHDPAGTIEMKPPEAFYNSGKGEPVINHRSDIWSGSVTMMNVLVGKETKWGPHDQIKKFINAITCTVRTVSDDLATSCKKLDDLVNKLKSSEVIGSMCADFEALKESLNDSNDSLRKMQSFQGGVPEVYKEECPLAGILSAVYIVNSLHWVCLSKLPKIYGTNLWSCMIKTLDCIAEGVKFFQDNRQDARQFVEVLNQLQIEVMK